MNFSLKILGSSSAMPTPNRFSTAQVLNVLERFFLIDCGEGTQIQFRRFNIRIGKLNHILISHLHGDHFLGIFGIISSFNLLDRKHPLNIYGPFKLKELLDVFISTLDQGLGYEIIFHPLKYEGKQLLFEDDKVRVESFPLRHRISTCGFLFTEKERLKSLRKDRYQQLQIPLRAIQSIREGNDYVDDNGAVYKNDELTFDAPLPRSYAFVSDTAKLERIIEIIKGVDLLYHEATYADDGKKRAKETGHSTARQAAEIAKAANVKKLIIGHYSNRYGNLDLLLDQAKEVFPETYLAIDGGEFTVPAEHRKIDS